MSGFRWLAHPTLTLLLTVIWLMLANTFGFGHLLLGLLLGWAIPLLCRDFLIAMPRVRRPFRLGLFVLQVFADILVANLHVARLVLGPEARLNPAFVEVPMAIEDEFVLALLTNIISLTPGTVSADLDVERRTLLLHALDAPDPARLVAEVKRRYETPLLEIFQCSPT
ncbi:sodium hydrogen antiporter subunitE, ShaE [Azotobacter vinelandii CA]|uniref:Sodium hydrogen antiporter subunitE, ShaE n=2 Tax=Azotobacter vinelandii TaxID=354 RepID=C1DEI0_AZOVD|nr:Na+/H+ antiporter subunit E [Azotobacter vinelandii]ACO78165.1 sodium hydrogen antiporter subunitE, ShaE [Azotobacter vinelandii DJ]AGK15110.1 sodium hydrogen antiporter subunitE, ShaE [Azotobacter vinelandii CA]AGK20299.1 sodium hydrogen antiporter subunitE, ShaE [Azotobacter vinelandii CA6]WKN23873.1 Na+/H+ antiporter subunit E [Azotobacter vinelandii]SFX55270.1 multisubunit potassium/proton antiporter, PhaE subunit [Azotobacter vinelandii]